MHRNTMPGNRVHGRRVIFKRVFYFFVSGFYQKKKTLSRRLATGNVKRLTAVGQKGSACVRAYRDRHGGGVYIIISLNRVRVGRESSEW